MSHGWSPWLAEKGKVDQPLLSGIHIVTLEGAGIRYRNPKPETSSKLHFRSRTGLPSLSIDPISGWIFHGSAQRWPRTVYPASVLHGNPCSSKFHPVWWMHPGKTRSSDRMCIWSVVASKEGKRDGNFLVKCPLTEALAYIYIYMSPSRVTQITFPSYPDVERVRRRVGPMSKEISSCSLLFLSSGCLSVCMYAWHWNGKLASITAGFTSSSTYLAITRVASRSKYRTSFILVGRTGLRNYRKIFCGVIR